MCVCLRLCLMVFSSTFSQGVSLLFLSGALPLSELVYSLCLYNSVEFRLYLGIQYTSKAVNVYHCGLFSIKCSNLLRNRVAYMQIVSSPGY